MRSGTSLPRRRPDRLPGRGTRRGSGEEFRALAHTVQSYRERKEVERALRSALADRDRVQEELRLSVEREKEARAAEMRDRCKEIFIAILGHDLRKPLNTILTTTRLMAMRGELCSESKKPLERVVGSGERMERMIEQVLDLTSASLGGGIVIRKRRQDLVQLATKIVNEVRSGRVAATEFRTHGSCEACVDEDRFEQVVSNLLDNVVKHGAPQTPIRVALTETGATVSLTVEVYSNVLGGTRASASFPKND